MVPGAGGSGWRRALRGEKGNRRQTRSPQPQCGAPHPTPSPSSPSSAPGTTGPGHHLAKDSQISPWRTLTPKLAPSPSTHPPLFRPLIEGGPTGFVFLHLACLAEQNVSWFIPGIPLSSLKINREREEGVLSLSLLHLCPELSFCGFPPPSPRPAPRGHGSPEGPVRAETGIVQPTANQTVTTAAGASGPPALKPSHAHREAGTSRTFLKFSN